MEPIAQRPEVRQFRRARVTGGHPRQSSLRTPVCSRPATTHSSAPWKSLGRRTVRVTARSAPRRPAGGRNRFRCGPRPGDDSPARRSRGCRPSPAPAACAPGRAGPGRPEPRKTCRGSPARRIPSAWLPRFPVGGAPPQGRRIRFSRQPPRWFSWQYLTRARTRVDRWLHVITRRVLRAT